MVNRTELCNSTLSSLLVFPLTHALKLTKVIPGPGQCSLKTGGPASVSWIVEEGDPPHFSLELINKDTLDTFEIAREVNASVGSVIWNLEDVPGSLRHVIAIVTSA